MLEKQLPLNELTAVGPLDGRYRERVSPLASYLSEYGLIKTRFEVEARYLIALSDAKVARRLSKQERQKLNGLGDEIDLTQATKVKKIEDETRHDVKAMERAFREMVSGTSLEDLTEMIHFGLTSEDVNNLAYRLMLKRATDTVMIPVLDEVVDQLTGRAEEYKSTPMLARTHGQSAVPTTVGKEFSVFASRLNRQVRMMEKHQLRGKLTGAVGNMNALYLARPNVDWIKFSQGFVSSLGLEPNMATTQIDPYEDVIELLQNYQRINGVIVDFDQDMWRYISDFWIAQVKRPGEVGSSTMPQKVNPIDFENSEGNLQTANSLIDGLVRKLAISRLQRDLSDSTSIRNFGAVLGHSLVGYKSTITGLERTKVNEVQISNDLNRDWTILSEGVQTILRDRGVEDPYSLVAGLSRGEHVTREGWKEWVDNLPVTEEDKVIFRNLTPENYIGLARELTELAIKEIRESRK
ncbi:MAG: adenylosuccinate lyase [Candidatus Daviesbacteria bacterium]|nr:adenylosuccinate lyase [Candidatus Daviesbacteria bacterium]